MREPLPKRDQREIVVPARGQRTAPPRRTLGADPASRRSGWLGTTASAIGGAGRLCLRRPGEVLGSVVAIGAVAAVAMNALGFQGGRHPAPIFSNVGQRPAQATGDRPASARTADPARAAEPSRLAEVKATEAASRKVDPPKAEPAVETRQAAVTEPARPATAKVAPGPTTKRDVISEIIKAGETTASVTTKPDAAVAQAQRALVKLGYGPLTADGVLGPGTRAAIEKFERDRKLPVKGVPAGRTLRELAARAGTPKG